MIMKATNLNILCNILESKWIMNVQFYNKCQLYMWLMYSYKYIVHVCYKYNVHVHNIHNKCQLCMRTLYSYMYMYNINYKCQLSIILRSLYSHKYIYNIHDKCHVHYYHCTVISTCTISMLMSAVQVICAHDLCTFTSACATCMTKFLMSAVHMITVQSQVHIQYLWKCQLCMWSLYIHK